MFSCSQRAITDLGSNFEQAIQVDRDLRDTDCVSNEERSRVQSDRGVDISRGGSKETELARGCCHAGLVAEPLRDSE
jgi:hypothetical protein